MGSEALAGLSLVFPLIMLMQQMANSSMGGAIASASKADIGACPRDVRFTPKSGHCIAPQRMSAMCQLLLDHLVSGHLQCQRQLEA